MGTAKTESAKARFKRLAEARVSKALDAIESIGKLAAPANYEYSVAQVTAINGALKSQIDVMNARFKNPGAAPKSGFTFK